MSMNKNILVITFAVAICFIGGIASAGEIHDAAERGDVAKVKELLASGANVNDEFGR